MVYIKTRKLTEKQAFKIRGAYNKIMKMDDELSLEDLLHHAGNHALGVGYAAQQLGTGYNRYACSYPLIKVYATKALGAEVVLRDGS